MCCTGNGTQGLYYAWEGILREKNGIVLVNLLLNRVSKWVDVDSYLPYEGKVVVKNKRARSVCVRIPSWVDRKQIQVTVANSPRNSERIGNYLLFGGLQGEEEITLKFPVPESTATYTVMANVFRMEKKYTCTFRGSTLVDISPRDTSPNRYPLYLRDHLRKDKAPIKKVMRFVPDRIISNW